MRQKPDNYLVFSILVTMFCCLPFGIVAIVKSCGVDSAYLAGDVELAVAESRSAKKWCLISLFSCCVPLVVYVLCVMFMVILAAAGAGE